MISDMHNASDSAGPLAMEDSEDMFHSIFREANAKADKFIDGAREQGSSWSSRCGQPGVLRLFFDGGVKSQQGD